MNSFTMKAVGTGAEEGHSGSWRRPAAAAGRRRLERCAVGCPTGSPLGLLKQRKRPHERRPSQREASPANCNGRSASWLGGLAAAPPQPPAAALSRGRPVHAASVASTTVHLVHGSWTGTSQPACLRTRGECGARHPALGGGRSTGSAPPRLAGPRTSRCGPMGRAMVPALRESGPPLQPALPPVPCYARRCRRGSEISGLGRGGAGETSHVPAPAPRRRQLRTCFRDHLLPPPFPPPSSLLQSPATRQHDCPRPAPALGSGGSRHAVLRPARCR